ncbi:sensor domain-containing diguanylate cyclase [Aliivibrio salmonicida]|uniref:sensor domain-containing diguanylate cyclase n=1 Tax=Aliivibrio salmonicida TaxID=40269 RepID=UPI00406C0DAD
MKVKRIIFGGSLLLLSIASMCAVTYVVKSYQKQSRIIEGELKFNANFVSVWLQTAFYHSNYVLDQLSNELTQDGFAELALSDDHYKEQSEVFELHHQTLMNAIHVFAVDKECVLLKTKTMGGVDLSSREYCQKLRNNDGEIDSVITAPFKDILNRNVIVQGVKITDKEGSFAGIVGLLTDFIFFTKALKGVNLSEGSTITILSRDFTVLATSIPRFFPIGDAMDFDYVPYNKINRLKYNQELMFDSEKKYNGNYQGVFVKKVSDLPFIILVTKAKDYWITPLYITIATVFSLLFALMLFLVKNVYYFHKLDTQAQHYSKLALYDDLTGSCNRRCFKTKIIGYFDAYNKTSVTFSIVLFDIDYFKQINDTYGHDVGDEVLRQFSLTCEKVCSENDLFARLGGDEFVMVLGNQNTLQVESILNELLISIRNINVLTDANCVNFTCSIGVSEVQGNSSDINDLLNKADEALYQAKKQGRNRVVVYQY